MLHTAFRLSFPLASQIDADTATLIQPTLFNMGLHPDIILDNDELLLSKPDSFWRMLGNQYRLLGLEPSFHLPFHGLNLGSRTSEIRRISAHLIRRGLHAASLCGAKVAVLHSGHSPLLQTKPTEKWLAYFLPEFHCICTTATQLGVKIALENTWEIDTILFERISKESDSIYGYCLDIGHCHVFSKLSPMEWASFYGERLLIIHLHDNDLREDIHLPVGQGLIDFSILPSLANGVTKPPRMVFEFKPRHLNPAVRLISTIFRVN